MIPRPTVFLLLERLPQGLHHVHHSFQVKQRDVLEALLQKALVDRQRVCEQQLLLESRVLLPVQVCPTSYEAAGRAHNHDLMGEGAGHVEVESHSATDAVAHEHLENAEVVAGDVADPADGRVLLHKSLEQTVHLLSSPAGQVSQEVDDVGAHGVQAAPSHELVTDPVVLVAEQAAPVDPHVADDDVAHVVLLYQLLHLHEGGQETQHVANDAHQLGVVPGSCHHPEGIHRGSSFLTQHVLPYSCSTNEKKISIFSALVQNVLRCPKGCQEVVVLRVGLSCCNF